MIYENIFKVNLQMKQLFGTMYINGKIIFKKLKDTFLI